jgi:predicted HTH transcriptional regulator
LDLAVRKVKHRTDRYFCLMEIRASRMTLSDLRNLVQSGEHQYLEFKRVIASPEKIARELCAFANASGGTVVIGVDDNRTIVGLSNYYEEQFDLEKAAALCEPDLKLELEILPHGHKDVLIVYVPEAKEKPVCVKEGEQKKAYLRRGHESMVLSREEKAIMKKKHSPEGVSFRYGEYEQRLFRFLKEYTAISVQEYANLIGVSSRKASELLTNLAAADILELGVFNGAEKFLLKAHPAGTEKKR